MVQFKTAEKKRLIAVTLIKFWNPTWFIEACFYKIDEIKFCFFLSLFLFFFFEPLDK